MTHTFYLGTAFRADTAARILRNDGYRARSNGPRVVLRGNGLELSPALELLTGYKADCVALDSATAALDMLEASSGLELELSPAAAARLLPFVRVAMVPAAMLVLAAAVYVAAVVSAAVK